MELEKSGRKILEILVPHLKKTVPGSPQTYLGYKFVHEQLNLTYFGQTWGDSLKKQGLAALADWTYANNFPGITGIIVNTATYEPGKGYFNLFGKNQDDFTWWEEEVKKSKKFDWSEYIYEEFNLKPIDLEAPARKDLKVSRIIRDSKLARQVKSLNDFECQICGLTINMPTSKKYAEAHHIIPMGKPHNGPDVIENIICVCPNHHAMLDYGTIKLDLGSLSMKNGYGIDNESIKYHNEVVYKS